MSRRPSVSIYNYPEDLNPFNDDSTSPVKPINNGTKQMTGEPKNSVKEPKNKFWTFGRSKKKPRSNSFSIKSTWNGLFGKRKDSQEVEIRKPTIATVSSTYKRGTYNGYSETPARLSKDQQEFDEALGTLARRRKYTLDNSSRYSSTLTVNGDPGKIYETIPQDNTTSILANLTPKAPARRFGQVSPKPTDKIPPLDYSGKERTSNGNILDERIPNRTPIPPKRGGPRSSQRSLAPVYPNDDVSLSPMLRDDMESVPDDYVFKRVSHDAIRKSNLSINSCVSVGSTVSAYGRKKRRAPQPPSIKEPLETPKENNSGPSEVSKTELQIVEPIDIARVTENIDEMTKRNRELDENFVPTCSVMNKPEEKDEISIDESKNEISSRSSILTDAGPTNNDSTELRKISNDNVTLEGEESSIATAEESRTNSSEASSSAAAAELRTNCSEASSSATEAESCTNCLKEKPVILERQQNENSETNNKEIVTEVEVELRRKVDDKNIETIKDVDCYSSMEALELKRHKSSSNLSRSDSFSVKEEIEKIERQIKLLEATSPREENNTEDTNEIYERGGTRLSLRETRMNFFRNMAESDRVKVELRELPREQKDISIVRIEDPPLPIEGPTEPVKIIELHISEPIRQKPAIIERDINPIPKPRRHSNLDAKEARVKVRHDKEDNEKRGNSL